MTKCHCPTCKEAIEITYPLNIGEFSESSGWKFVFVHENTIWFCPSHKEKIETLAEKIFEITGDSDVFFSTLLPRHFKS